MTTIKTRPTFWSSLWHYWYVLMRLCAGERVIYEEIDASLTLTTVRSRYAAVWSALLLSSAIAVSVVHRHAVKSGTNMLGIHQTPALIVALAVAAAFVVSIVGYTLLRVYTLIAHNLTTSLFQVRGQRLRLLATETTLLCLVVPISLTVVIAILWPTLGWSLFSLVLFYAVAIMARAYNHIFHLKGFRGLWVLLGSTVVTCFVLAIGALAIGVAIAVLGFGLLLILRGFQRSGS